MAKDLPYFKFFCSEWNDGDITLEDYNVQGVFINVCSYYWSKECNLESKMLYKRFKNVKEEIDTLISEGHIKISEGFVEINFLNEQGSERMKQSKIKRKGGLASAEARRLKKIEHNFNTPLTEIEHVLKNSSTESQLLREDKIREDKIREDKIREEKQKEKEPVFNFRKELLNLGGEEQLVSDWLLVRKKLKATNTKTALNRFLKQVELSGKDLNFALGYVAGNGYKGFEAKWLDQSNSFGVKKQNNQLNADGTFKMS